MGIELGMSFLDTAEIYGDGLSEEIIGKVISNKKREELFIATKFLPKNSSYEKVLSSLESSLKRLRTEYVDLYQVHWPNPSIPIYETLEAMAKLLDSGKIQNIGLCNFSKREIIEAQKFLPTKKIFFYQYEYSLFDRFIEDSIMPFIMKNDAFTIAYSPLDKGRLVDGESSKKMLMEIANKYNKTPSQIALNWLTSKPNVICIPKSKNPTHMKQNASSTDFVIEPKDLEIIENFCASKRQFVDPMSIKVSLEGEGGNMVYQTIEEAIENKLKMSPSPIELAEFIKNGDSVKPVRLIKASSKKSQYLYYLLEGRLRYWAWVIAFDGKKKIPALIRSE